MSKSCLRQEGRQGALLEGRCVFQCTHAKVQHLLEELIQKHGVSFERIYSNESKGSIEPRWSYNTPHFA